MLNSLVARAVAPSTPGQEHVLLYAVDSMRRRVVYVHVPRLSLRFYALH